VGIFDRLGDVIKSYLNDEDGRIFSRPRGGDPDLEEAEAELEGFLRGDKQRAWGERNSAGPGAGDWGPGRGTGDWGGDRATGGSGKAGEGRNAGRDRGTGERWSAGEGRNAGRDRGAAGPAGKSGDGLPPEELRRDFAELGLPFGAGAEECKAAYKRLLKLHHPDRHAGHEGNMRKATEKSARINAAYDRIETWRRGS
jgi:hypothetical protein